MYNTLILFTFLLISLSIYCMTTKKNIIKTVIGVEILTSSINLNFVIMGAHGEYVDALAQSFAIVSIAVGASVAALALALIINVYRHYGKVDWDALRRLRW
ncbi:MAG: NADH-quinone oxidoreductase subunit NuoK [Nitrososphaeria archaeon]